MTQVEPANGTVSNGYGGFSLEESYANYSTIVFAVPNGTYGYNVAPAAEFNQSSYGPASGTVIVNGTNVVVRVDGPYVASCGPLIPQTPKEQSGPISTFPAWWLDCIPTSNITTVENLDLNSSSDFDHINLTSIYDTIIGSDSFKAWTYNEGWVVAEWTASVQAGNSNATTGADIVTALFVLTPLREGLSPPGYVWANYNLQTNGVGRVTFAQSYSNECPDGILD